MPSTKSSINFINASAFDASIYVVDAGGNETHVVDLSPAQSSKQETFEGQIWVVKDKDTGQQVGTVTGKVDDQTYEIMFLRGRGAPEQAGGGGG